MSAETYGWCAALVSMLAFGSFGVPIKCDAARKHDIDPLVFQTYKSIVCFVTSWAVLLVGVPFRFTYWGIVSAIFWVPGGIATVYAVKNAGLAVGIGVASSFIVLVSFVWGVGVFREPIHSVTMATGAILCMMMGLIGMSYFSHNAMAGAATTGSTVLECSIDPLRSSSGGERVEYQGLPQVRDEINDDDDENDGIIRLPVVQHSTQLTLPRNKYPTPKAFSFTNSEESTEDPSHSHAQFTKRQKGILAAMFCGIYGGSIMAPMRFAPEDAKGAAYLVSFGIGAFLVTLALWMLRFLHNCVQYRFSPTQAYQALPGFHLRDMWWPGGIAGLLWSIGNLASILSVYYLGEGVGYPLSQASILVAGLWGLLWYKEVTGRARILSWLASAVLTVMGILLLSYEHHEA